MSFTPIANENSESANAAPVATVMSVEKLNQALRQLIEGQMGLVWVQGEISNFKAHTSGHYYFSLKDSKAQVSAVMFRGHNSRLKFKPTDGLEVIIRGRITVYEPRGNYQLMCEQMEPVGAGALQKAFEQLKEKLKLEGLFEANRKKAIPPLPKHVVIVTSPTGAAIRDMIHVLQRRNKMVKITLIPTIVQGESAAPQIIEALKKAERISDADVVIVGRGGGSIEDLWAFNDENLARTISQMRLPVISAVGHEIDFTICDFVADMRAPTPSAAAEIVSRSTIDLSGKVVTLRRSLALAMEKRLRTLKLQFDGQRRRLVDPKRKLQDHIFRNDELMMRLKRALEVSIQRSRFQLERKMGMLSTMNPLKVVERGYSIVSKDSKLVKEHRQIKKGDQVEVQLSKGGFKAEVTSVFETKGESHGL